MINVTKPFLPPLDEVYSHLANIWDSSILTNGGPVHQAFERELGRHLGVEHLSLYSNGTLALKAAIKILGLSGEVITTPFSFVATANVLVDCGIKPVFVDIDPVTFNIDPNKIEDRINSNTTGFMPVHVYGIPCAVEEIAAISARHDLPTIYDAAHAFGVTVSGKSVLGFGDASALSFHSTKVFHTIEGGALALNRGEHKQQSDQYKNFGFTGETSVEYFGINAKMNELQSAVGLVNLGYMERVYRERRRVFELYNENLCDLGGLTITHAAINSQNFSYYPVLVDGESGITRDGLYAALKSHGINARRYFYPLIPDFEIYRAAGFDSEEFPVAKRVSEQVLCLPVFAGMTDDQVIKVIDAVKKAYLVDACRSAPNSRPLSPERAA